jgi:integrase
MQTTLALPPSPVDTSAIDRANLQPSTKAQYAKAIQQMHAAGVNPSNHAQLQAYADGLKQSSRQFLKSALRLMTLGVEQDIKAGATPANLPQTQAALYRLEAMRGAVQVQQPKGTKANVWLSAAQVLHLTALCSGDTIEQRRDWIVLGTLLGAGLRREELATLTFDALKQQPTKGGKPRDVLEVTGKGNKTRVIPINQKLGDRLRAWESTVGGGRIARSLSRGTLGESLSSVGIFQLTNKYGARIGIPELAPHDLRRTYAQLGFENGVPLPQLSTLLGHSSVSTTQRYLNLSLDLESTASDFVPLS